MSYPWNHGKISRQAAEDLLSKSSTDGAFLVRQSESVSDAHVLSLWYDGMVHHFRILKEDNEYKVKGGDGSLSFSNLVEVIERFKQPEQGLVCPLKQPIIKESSIESDLVDSDDDDNRRDQDDDRDEVDGPQHNVLSVSLIDKMSKMDMSGFDNEFSRKLQNYVNNGFLIDTFKKDTSAPTTALQELIAELGEGVKGEMRDFLRKITFMQELFNSHDDFSKLIPSATGSIFSRNQTIHVSDFDELCDDFAMCLAGVKSLRTLVVAQKIRQGNNIQESQTKTFEVSACGNFKTKGFIKVDITEGKLWFMKNVNDSLEDSTTMSHDKILQLVKDAEAPKLTFKIDNKSNREYLFKNIQARENLFQLVYFMKNHSPGGQVDPKEITVFVGTWNMGGVAPENMDSWIKCSGQGEVITSNRRVGLAGHDMYAIGTQESSIGENTWISRLRSCLKNMFNIDYYHVAVQSLWGIRLVILAKVNHRNRISHVERSCVKTGIANKLGNKGGVGISFVFMSTSFCFINTHLTSGNEDVRKERRKQNYVDILKGLNLGHKSAYDLTNQFHHVFWFGDLNYRIDMDIDVILDAIKDQDYKKLMINDQLDKEKKDGNVFFGFDEHDIHFPPTYRYKRGTRSEYEHQKIKRSGIRINVPSWCDRVLWKSFPQLSVEQISYGCTDDILTSDHSPVFASYQVPITSQFVASQDQRDLQSPNNSSCEIIFQLIKAQVKTRSKTNFYLEFSSRCLATSVKSVVGSPSAHGGPRNVNSNPAIDCCAQWNVQALPQLTPILDDVEYLKEQHLMIAVKSESGDESYGECVLSLKSHIFSSTQSFATDLTHGGIKTGIIEGSMNVSNPRDFKQFEISSKPVTHGKLEAGYRKHATVHPSSVYRPVSCISPNVSENVDGFSRKSLSLGRQSQKRRSEVNQGYPVREVRDNIYAKAPKSHVTANANFDSELIPPPLPSRIPENPSEKTKLTPPPLPVKLVRSPSFPTTVEQFMCRLGLNEYSVKLIENGFDDMVFLEEISGKDLVKVGISKTEHITQILREIDKLKQSGFFSRR